MSSPAHSFRPGQPAPPLRDAFLRWQCRVRQSAMRDAMGRPDDAIMPEVTLAGEDAAMGQIITMLCKLPAFSKTSEFQHMFKSTHDPAQRREKAVQLCAATFYQKAGEFSDTLTAIFAPGSSGATALCEAGACQLVFDAYGQRFEVSCAVAPLAKDDALFQATWWHSALFNPALHPNATILGFEPDWAAASAQPAI